LVAKDGTEPGSPDTEREERADQQRRQERSQTTPAQIECDIDTARIEIVTEGAYGRIIIPDS
jgi:hypothetical protein